jgi:hypothetical protein
VRIVSINEGEIVLSERTPLKDTLEGILEDTPEDNPEATQEASR